MHSSIRTTLGLLLILFGAGCGSSSTSIPTPSPAANTTDQPPAALDTFLFTSDIWAGSPNGLREVYSMNSNAPGTPNRLTFSNNVAPALNVEASSAPGRSALAVRRVTSDTNGDSRLDDQDNAELVFVAYTTPVTETTYVQSTFSVDGLDYSPAGTDIAYSGVGAGGLDDIYDIGTAGTGNVAVTNTASIGERRPRFDPTGTIVAFEYHVAGLPNAVYIYDSSGNEDAVDLGISGAQTPLPGTPYMVGGDADPSFSPAGSSVVFRRLTGIPNTQGSWDVLVSNGTTVTTLASGNLYRGAPDWGPSGILYVETDFTLGTSSIILIAPDGSGRTVLYTAPAGYTVANPRWLH